MTKQGRNTPCWCGSGKKFKVCHLNREQQVLENPWHAIEATRKAFKRKLCTAHGGLFGDCDGQIVKAHSISKGANLSAIAKNGHVIQYQTNIKEMNKNGGKLVATKVGIGDASTFNGFCAAHDRTLFSCIENEAFTGRPDQCLAIAYRTLSREAYGKDSAAQMRSILRDADKGLHPLQQRLMQDWLAVMETHNAAAQKELRHTHSLLSLALSTGNTSALRSMVIQFRSELPFMLAGAWSPFTDLKGVHLQYGGLDELLEQIFISTFARPGTGYICVSWVDKPGAPGKVIADQIRSLPTDVQANACMQLGVKHIENAFFSPNWFEALTNPQRAQLDRLAANGMDAMGSPPASPIRLDLIFELPSTLQIFDS